MMVKKRIRFNFLDVLIVLSVLLLVVGIIWREELTERIETRNNENTVTLCCEFNATVNGTYAVRFEDGKTPVYLNDIEIGYVEIVGTLSSGSVSENDSTDSGEDESSEEEETEVIVSDSKLYIKAVAKESGYYLNGDTKLLIGEDYSMHTKTSEFTVCILSVEEIKQQ